jgi:hypothetical protein
MLKGRDWRDDSRSLISWSELIGSADVRRELLPISFKGRVEAGDRRSSSVGGPGKGRDVGCRISVSVRRGSVALDGEDASVLCDGWRELDISLSKFDSL